MSRIFISYRRADSEDASGRIYDALEREFGEGNIFKDVYSIPLGTDFRQALRQAVGGRRMRADACRHRTAMAYRD